MLGALLAWIAKSNGAKTAGAAATGSVTSMIVLMGIVDAKVDTKIQDAKQEVKRELESKHELVSTNINHIKEDQREIKQLLRTINQRVYELNRKKGD